MKNPMERPVRIGKINYVNVLPFFHGLEKQLSDMQVELIEGVPSGLNRMLADGQLDLAPVSSFAYAKHSAEWVMLPGISVSASSTVRSILLLHKKPVSEWKDVLISLTTSSETSVQLLKLITSSLTHANIRYRSAEPDAAGMLADSDAALVIGDDALRFLLHPIQDILITDLGQWWHSLTGEGMTYAVWAVRKAYVSRFPEQVNLIQRALITNMQRMTAAQEILTAESQKWLGGGEAFWNDYFSGLQFGFGRMQRKALHYYFERCMHAGWIQSVPVLPEAVDMTELQVGP